MALDIKQSIAKIKSGNQLGTGFLYDNQHLITCAHVIEDHNQITATFYDANFGFVSQLPIKLEEIFREEQGDIAILKLPNPILGSSTLTPIQIRQEETSQNSKGQEYDTYGFPFSQTNGLAATLTVDNPNHIDKYANKQLQFKEANAITQGFSGAPIIDSRYGIVIGMVRAITSEDGNSRGQEIVFGIPIERIISKLFQKEENNEKTPNQLPKELTPVNEILEEDIIGREKDIKEIHNQINLHKCLLLQGIGGIGKTNIALGYISKHKQQYDHIAWIPISNNLQKDLITFLSEIIDDFKYDEKQKPSDNFASLISKAKNRLLKNTLVVIDNADKLDDFNKKNTIALLKQTGWHVLITSRAIPLKGVIKIYTADKLSSEACKNIFYRYYEGNADNDSLEQLLKLTDYHTLLVKLLAKAGERYSIKQLYEIAKEGLRNEKLQEEIYENQRITNLYSLVVDELFILKEDEFLEKEKEYLKYFSIMPSQDIAYSDLQVMFSITKEQESEFWKTLRELSRKGWLIKGFDKDLDEHTYKMHLLVKESINAKLPTITNECNDLLVGLDEVIQTFPELEVAEKQRYIPFAESVIKSCKTVNEELLNLKLTLSERYYDFSQYKQCEKILNDILENFTTYEKAYRKALILKSRYFWKVSEYLKGKELILKAIKLKNENNTLSNYFESRVFDILGLQERGLSNYESAINAYEKSIEIINSDENMSEKRREATKAIRINNMAFVYYYGLEKKDLGISYLLKVTEIRKNYCGQNFAKLGITYSNLSSFYSKKGDFKNAKKYIQKCIRIRKIHLHETHEKWALTYRNTARVHYGFKEYEEAKIAIEKAIEIKKLYNYKGELHDYYDVYSICLASLMDKKACEIAQMAIDDYKCKTHQNPKTLLRLENNLIDINKKFI